HGGWTDTLLVFVYARKSKVRFLPGRTMTIPVDGHNRARKLQGGGKRTRTNFRVEDADFRNFRDTPTKQRKTQEPDPNPCQLPKSPQQREGDSGDIGVTERIQQEQIPAILGAKASGDEEGAAFDEDRQGTNGDRRKGDGRTTEKINDDIHFQRFRHPPKKEQPGGGIKGWTVIAVEVQDRSIQRSELFLAGFEITNLESDLPQRLQHPCKDPLSLHEDKCGSPDGQQAHAQECRGHGLTG